MPTTTATDVANFLLALADERGEEVNNLKLNKLLYYAQAWHLGIHGTPIFPEKFQAWSTGPMIPELYWAWKPFGIGHIHEHGEPPAFDERTRKLLIEVADEYLPVDEYDLASLTYSETPWIKARGRIDISEPCETELDEDEMRLYFKQLAEAA